MLRDIYEAIPSLVKNKALIALVVLLSTLNFVNYAYINKIAIIFVYCFEFILLVLLYDSLINFSENYDINVVVSHLKTTLKVLPRFVGLFIYFGIGALLIITIASAIFKSPNHSVANQEMVVYVSIPIISLFLSPFFLYSPIYVINNNCFVYESIREGYKFLLLDPIRHSIPAIIIAIIVLIKYQITADNHVIFFTKHLVFIFIVFYSISLSIVLFRKKNIQYISLKDKIEKGLIKKTKKKLFEIHRGKWK